VPAKKVKRKQTRTVEAAVAKQTSNAPKEVSGEMTDQQLLILIVILVAGFLLGLLAVSVKVAQ
jgi:hypothetical protein